MNATTLLCLSTWLATTGQVTPSVSTVAVVPVVVGGSEVRVSRLVSEIQVAAALRPSVRLLSMEDLFVAGGETALTAVKSCGSDQACVSERLRSVGASVGLLVVLNTSSSSPILGLRLFDTHSDQVLVVRTTPLTAVDDTLYGQLREMAEGVLDEAGYEKKAKLTVRVDPVSARVNVGGRREPEIGTSAIFFLPPGEYPVEASLEGYESVETQVSLLRGEQRELELILMKDGTFLSSPWFWVTMGLLVGGAAAATAIVMTSGSDQYCFCIPGPDGGCTGC
jgi:hypothetical protein